MGKIVLLTTAIPRGELHRETIGLFYEKIGKQLKDWEIYHVINLDNPLKLCDKFSRGETKRLLEEIIPRNVRRYFIETVEPNFCKAYVNVIAKVYEENILDKETLIWWLEDDWKVIGDYDVSKVLRFCGVKNGALSMTSNAPLCSFRGGPVMSYDFFVRFFDIHRNIDVKKDPEKRVRNYIHYVNVHKGDICVFVVYLLEYMGETLEFLEENSWFYRSRYNALRFDGGRLRYFMVMMEKMEDEHMYIYEYKSNNLRENRVKELKKIFRKIGMEELKREMGGNSISFFNIVPYMMEDVGRKFNRDSGLKKVRNSYG